MDHGSLSGRQIHSVVAFRYATEAARVSADGLATADIGKVAYQEDTGEHWVLTGTSPTWALLGLRVNGSPVSGIVTDASLKYDTTLGLPGVSAPVAETALSPGGSATTIHTIAVAASRDISVIADLRLSADDGSAGKRCNGSVVCTAKRYGSGALAITSQSAALPWVCDDPLWLPQFVTSSNNLLLQVTPDVSSTIQVRGRVRYELTDTSADVSPQAAAVFAAAVESLFSTRLIDQFILPTASGSDVTGWTGATSGKALANTVGTHFSLSTLGASARPAVTSAVGLQAQLRGAMGAAVKCILVFAAAPSLPVATYSVLANTGATGDVTNILMVSTSQTVLSANNVIKVDGVTTNTVPAAGGVHLFQLDATGNTDTDFGLGFSNNAFPWRAPVGCVVLLNAIPSAGEITTLLAAGETYFNG
jgi:hypothetical protein